MSKSNVSKSLSVAHSFTTVQGIGFTPSKAGGLQVDKSINASHTHSSPNMSGKASSAGGVNLSVIWSIKNSAASPNL